MPLDLSNSHPTAQIIELTEIRLNHVSVFDGLVLERDPAVALPRAAPFVERVHGVLRVGLIEWKVESPPSAS